MMSSKLPIHIRFKRLCHQGLRLMPLSTVSRFHMSSTDPYQDLYHRDGYKQIKELEKWRKLIHDISGIEENELHSAQNDILQSSTEYFNSEFGQFHHEALDLASITSSLTRSEYLLLYDAAITTHCIHIQSRVASFESKGFYTIGPCGEECLAPIGLILDLKDQVALHYRHLAVNIARNMKRQGYDGDNTDLLSNIIRDRARGYCVSLNDPISAGGHCLLGSSDFDHDYIVTSTLASQCMPAVGRAFGNVLCHALGLESPKFAQGSLSFVSLGDGSINNAHFLSAINIVDYAVHHNIKVPLLMCISNNKICISLRDKRNWLFSAMNKLLKFKKYKCDGNNIFDVYQQFKFASDYVRTTQKPAIIVIDEVVRQFGHAATDRQSAYLTPGEIEMAANNDLILKLSKQFIKLGVFGTKHECLQRILMIATKTAKEFETVYNESTLQNTPECRQIMKERACAPLVEYKDDVINNEVMNKCMIDTGILNKSVVMRKCMIYAIEEILNAYPHSVYIGEDVTHGGYYLVTDGLSAKYPLRIRDFPPDETALFGIGIGYAQAGLVPIVEMPYAKYLDCGADMFFEACVMNWLSNGHQPNGVLFRLQGFGNGLFGGNFHTHNALYIPPGLDVVCYSNGYDYVAAWRYNIQQVKNGRCCMSVDCTAQLNNRQVTSHIPNTAEYLTFNDIICYNNDNQKVILYDQAENSKQRCLQSDHCTYLDVNDYTVPTTAVNKKYNVAIITYGLGVNVSKQAQNEINHDLINQIVVIDVPYLSDVPNQLSVLLTNNKEQIDCIVFSDMCKEGQNPLNGIIAKLQQRNILQHFSWLSVAAQYTYNPLGRDLTFLSCQDILDTTQTLIQNHHCKIQNDKQPKHVQYK
eukprot:760312_1